MFAHILMYEMGALKIHHHENKILFIFYDIV